MILSCAKYEEIKETVVDLFERLNIHCIPINGFEIATKMGVKVIPYSAYSQSTQMLMRKRSQDGFSVKKEKWEMVYIL